MLVIGEGPGSRLKIIQLGDDDDLGSEGGGLECQLSRLTPKLL